jgi:hypothetical protein
MFNKTLAIDPENGYANSLWIRLNNKIYIIFKTDSSNAIGFFCFRLKGMDLLGQFWPLSCIL